MTTSSAQRSLLSITAMGGFFVLLSYYMLLPHTLPSQKIEPLWFGIDGALRTFYYASIVCSGIVFMGALYWVYYNINQRNARSYNASYALLLLSAMSWTVALWWWGRADSPVAVWSVLMALIGTTLGSLWLLYNVCMNNAPVWVVLCLAYLSFHVLALDNVGWFYAFYTTKDTVESTTMAHGNVQQRCFSGWSSV
jgi:hypothetical protein